jgi:hypothetical protein
MAYIHTYKVGDAVFYRVTGSGAAPGMNVTLTKGDWQGVSRGKIANNAIQWLKQLEPSKKEEEEKTEKKAMTSAVIKNFLRYDA